MLGSVQTRVTYPDGYRVSYSSDFQMSLEHGVYECDELVIDSTSYCPDQVSHDKELVMKILLEKMNGVLEKIVLLFRVIEVGYNMLWKYLVMNFAIFH